MQADPVLQRPDWQTTAAPAVHDDWPFARPHLALLPQLLVTHWFAPVQPVPFATAQVLVVRLQSPLEQTALASEHVPVCRVSFGIAVPAGSSALQVKLDRSQYCFEVQSASTQHPPAGMQEPAELQVPDWQTLVVPLVQPAWPLS